MAELSLPERLVHAAEAAIQGAGDTYDSPLGDKVDGYTVDFARMAGAAVIDALAEDMAANGGAGHAVLLRMLAQEIANVPALEGT